MFDVGFWELLVIGVIALLVIGPERLPQVASQAGRFISKINRFVSNFKDDINKELKAEELKNTLAKQAETLGICELIEDTKNTVSAVKGETQKAIDDLQADADPEKIAELDRQQAEVIGNADDKSDNDQPEAKPKIQKS